ncbi:MAG: methyltransferase domain-containing protein [Actinomycetota bacterium]|nr:methyltransferase domain-containing protein [Actinomycetota bacterium]
MTSSTRPRTAAPSEPLAPGTAIYDSLAPVYDLLTAGYDHGRWLAALERLALEHGLAGRRLLDVACGTGSSFLPLLLAGYEVTACDVSPAMAAIQAHGASGLRQSAQWRQAWKAASCAASSAAEPGPSTRVATCRQRRVTASHSHSVGGEAPGASSRTSILSTETV